MSSAGEGRAAIQAALADALRDLGALSVLFSQAVADRIGINPTDVECLDLLVRQGPLTAKRLAQLAGLTSGGTTFVIDRLERAGYVHRRPNPDDRRSVLIEADMEAAMRDFESLYASLARAVDEGMAHYSDADLALILDFTRGSQAVMRREIDRLRTADEAAPPANH